MKCFICCCCFVLLIIFYFFLFSFLEGETTRVEGRHGRPWEMSGTGVYVVKFPKKNQ